jgi:hypothetical protein
MTMAYLNNCQIPGLPRMSDGKAEFPPQSLVIRLKRMLARPWNHYVKKILQKTSRTLNRWLSSNHIGKTTITPVSKHVEYQLKAGDFVRVRSLEEIRITLNSYNEYKGCAFLVDMQQYCGTVQRVLKPLERFLDERDYQVKKAKGIVLLENNYCQGTPVFGRCDRSCLLFWREEWLEKIPEPSQNVTSDMEKAGDYA